MCVRIELITLDLCVARAFTIDQGVILPLGDDVVVAILFLLVVATANSLAYIHLIILRSVFSVWD